MRKKRPTFQSLKIATKVVKFIMKMWTSAEAVDLNIILSNRMSAIYWCIILCSCSSLFLGIVIKDLWYFCGVHFVYSLEEFFLILYFMVSICGKTGLFGLYWLYMQSALFICYSCHVVGNWSLRDYVFRIITNISQVAISGMLCYITSQVKWILVIFRFTKITFKLQITLISICIVRIFFYFSVLISLPTLRIIN